MPPFASARKAVLWGGRFKPKEKVLLPGAQYVHIYVAKGAVDLEGAGRLKDGDSVRLAGAGSAGLTADGKLGAEVLIWEMDEELQSN